MIIVPQNDKPWNMDNNPVLQCNMKCVCVYVSLLSKLLNVHRTLFNKFFFFTVNYIFR
jgi:hypothetical protein